MKNAKRTALLIIFPISVFAFFTMLTGMSALFPLFPAIMSVVFSLLFYTKKFPYDKYPEEASRYLIAIPVLLVCLILIIKTAVIIGVINADLIFVYITTILLSALSVPFLTVIIKSLWVAIAHTTHLGKDTDMLKQLKVSDLFFGKRVFHVIADILICLLISFIAAIATKYYEGTATPQVLFNTFTIFLSLSSLMFVIWGLMKWSASFCLDNKPKFICALDRFFAGKYAWIKLAVIIFICWLPILLILYPGTLSNDTWGQLNQVIRLFDGGINDLSDHHPIFSTFVISLGLMPIAKITGDWQIAFFVFVLIQALLTALSFSAVICYANKKLHIGSVTCVIIAAVYAFLYVYPQDVQVIGKDPLFAWVFILFMLYFIEAIRSNGDALNSKSFLWKLIVLSLLCCLLKKVAFYVIFASFLILVIFMKNRKKLIIPLLAPAILMFVLMPAIMNFANVRPGGKQEMFSLPFQMTARYVLDNPEDITAEEYAVIDTVLEIDTLAERYNPIFADPVKGYYQRGTGADYIKYIGVFISQGLRHPVSYIKGAAAMISGWFSTYPYFPTLDMDWHNQLVPELIPESVTVRTFSLQSADAYRDALYEIYYGLAYMLSPLALLMSNGLFASFIPAFTFLASLRNNKKHKVKYILMYLPIFLSIILGCWLAPASVNAEGTRYIMPVVYCLPLMILIGIASMKKEPSEADTLSCYVET